MTDVNHCRLVIFGSRQLSPTAQDIWSGLDELGISWKTNIVVGSGMCSGPDMIGKRWAKSINLPIKEFPADWRMSGYAAGPIRNKKMAEWCTHAIGFWDEVSRGTANMCAHVVLLRKPVVLKRLGIDSEPMTLDNKEAYHVRKPVVPQDVLPAVNDGGMFI